MSETKNFEDISYIIRIAGDYKLLTREEEQELAKIIQHARKGKRVTSKQRQEAKDAVERFILCNLRFVIHIGKSYQFRGLEFNDIISEGVVGLRKAAIRYEPRGDVRFTTYAAWWIKQCITRAIYNKAQTIRIPIHKIQKISSIQNAKRILAQNGEEPSNENVADLLDLTPEEVQRILEVATLEPVSLHTPIVTEDKDIILQDFIPDENAVQASEVAEANDTLSEILNVIDKALTKKEKKVIQDRFGLNASKNRRTLEELGQDYGITRERIRQIEAKALRKLQKFLLPLYKETAQDPSDILLTRKLQEAAFKTTRQEGRTRKKPKPAPQKAAA